MRRAEEVTMRPAGAKALAHTMEARMAIDRNMMKLKIVMEIIINY